MKQEIGIMDFAGNKIRYRLRNENTKKYFGSYMQIQNSDTDSDYDLLVTDQCFEFYHSIVLENSPESFREFRCFLPLTAHKVLNYNCMLFHGVAFTWKGKAWLLTAPSGTGKTTQYRLWKKLFGDEVELICGDTALLEFKDNQEVWVHPTPWNGKERMQATTGETKLEGIFYLIQGNKNEIRKLNISKCVSTMMCQIITLPDTMDLMRKQCELAEKLLTNIPIKALINKGDENSVLLTSKYITKYLEETYADSV